MKTILPGLILCGVMSIFAASFCLAQDADENEVIKGPQFRANFIVPKSSVSPDGRYGVLARRTGTISTITASRKTNWSKCKADGCWRRLTLRPD